MTSPFKYLPNKMASASVCVCVCACAVEIKPGTLRVSLVYACRRKYCLTYTEQDGNFPSKNGVIQYGLYTVSC